jgi:hypothetical protein
VRGKLVLGRVEPAKDLSGAFGEQSPGLGEPDSPPGAPDDLGAGLCLQPRQVSSRAAPVTDPCRATAASTRSRVTSSMWLSIDLLDFSLHWSVFGLSDQLRSDTRI